MYDASNRKDVRRAEKYAKVSAANRAEIITYIMSTAPSRAWLHDLLVDLGFFLITNFAPDSRVHSFNEGQRSVAQRLVNDIFRACPRNFTLMIEEANARDVARSGPDRNLSNGNRGDQGPDVGAEGGANVEGDYDPYEGKWLGDEDRA